MILKNVINQALPTPLNKLTIAILNMFYFSPLYQQRSFWKKKGYGNRQVFTLILKAMILEWLI